MGVDAEEGAGGGDGEHAASGVTDGERGGEGGIERVIQNAECRILNGGGEMWSGGWGGER
jgi:hypothetical protein